MKIAFTGKGGVGKSTITALCARYLSENGHSVMAFDADPDMNLSTIFGLGPGEAITPITGLKELIAERTETRTDTPAPVFKMNPRVDDIPDSYSVVKNGIRLMVMGPIRGGGKGCACPENAFLKQLVGHLVLQRKEAVLMDMEAGLEHFGRGTALGVDLIVAVVEPSATSLETAARIVKASQEIGIRRVIYAANKVADEADLAFIRDGLGGTEPAGVFRYSADLARVSQGRQDLFGLPEAVMEQAAGLVKSFPEAEKL